MLRFTVVIFHRIFILLSLILQRHRWLLLLGGLMITAPSFAAYIPLTGVSKIAAGGLHTCTLTSGGGVKCWGLNSSGQLGDSSTTNRLTAVDVSGLTSGVTAITAGIFHTCALTSGGGVKCWGQNMYGQLGDTSSTDRLTPVDVSGLTSGVTAITAEGSHTCALISGGGVKCWGQNMYGQLGDNSTTNRLTPVDVSGLTSGVVEIVAGGGHSCAITIGGGAKCWGLNGNGQLGDNSTTNRLTSVDVSGLTSGVTAITAGNSHTCALTSGGGIKCWGNNANGQLGDNSTANRLTSVDVSGLTSGVVAITAGAQHTCAITVGGGAKCWGQNLKGRLGDNSTTNRLTSVDVSGLTSGVTAITAGDQHTCAVTSGGGMKCWGYNSAGQLGDNSTTDSPIPIDVLVSDTPTAPPTIPSNQTISFIPPANGTTGGTATLSATATSGLTVIFSSATPSVCTVSGTTVNYIAAGTCTINADQPGDTNFNAAPQVIGNITVTNTTTPVPPPSPPPTSSTGSSSPGVSVTATAPTANGTAAGAMSNYNQTATNLTILENSSISGGTLAGNTTNSGLVANVTIAPNSTITGGTLSGFNTNLGTLNNVTISQYSEVRGGNYTGTINNNGTLINPILLPNSSVINGGVLENPVILPDVKVTGGKLIGTIIVLGTYEAVEIPPSAKIITRVANIPPATFQQLNAQTLAQLPASVISQITPEQFAQIPVTALSGLTAENMGAIAPQVIQSFDKPRINALDVQEFKAMPTEGVAKLLTNFNVEHITLQEAEQLLPPQWKIDSQGNLTAPPNSKIALKSLNISELPSGLTLPNMTDLNSSFALGGRGTYPLIKQINQVINKDGFIATQQKTGVIQVQKFEADVAKQQFGFMIDSEQIFVLDEQAAAGLQINEQGQYLIVTEDRKRIPITPMTKVPEGLLAVLGNEGAVDIQHTGEVLLKHQIVQRSRDGHEIHTIGIFDPFVEPAPGDICTPEGICDWSKVDELMQPGLRTARNVRAQAAAKVIYPDGTSQKIYPAVLFPDIFVAEVQKMAGVEKAIFRMDGIIAVTYQGSKLWLIPTFEAQVQPIPAGKKFKPSLILEKGTLTYQVPYGDNLVISQLSIIEAPSP